MSGDMMEEVKKEYGLEEQLSHYNVLDNINDIQLRCYEIADLHGWHDVERSGAEICALIHSEISEALEEMREGNPPIIEPETKLDKPEGWAIEMADAVIRIMDCLGKHDISLGELIKMKNKYNESRECRHGKVF